MPNARPLLAGFLLALPASCTGLTDPGRESELRVTRDPPELLLTNAGSRPVYFTAYEETTAALTLWGPCDDPERCPRVAPGERRALSYGEVSGYRPGADVALVYWWHLEPEAGGGFRADSVRVESVRF